MYNKIILFYINIFSINTLYQEKKNLKNSKNLSLLLLFAYNSVT